MQATTTGEFRVLDGAHAAAGPLTLLDLESLEPTLVAADGYDDPLAETVTGLRPGYVLDATLEWTDGTARFTEVSVTSFTLIEYAQGVSGLFEAALETISEARRENVGITGRPTYSTDGEPNGAVYAFAEQRGERDVFDDIRAGRLPLEPLVARLAEGGEDATVPDHELFVMRPVDHDYVVVYLVLTRDSLLADTVRDTYDCPRPPEPLRG
jgi:hypothetical protein